MATWYGGWTSLLRSPKHPLWTVPDNTWRSWPDGSNFGAPMCSDYPPLNLQPSHLKLHQKDVRSASVAVPIQGTSCPASYPSISARGIDLREVVSWALLCCADADGNRRKHDMKPPQPGKSMKEWHGPINHTKSTTACPTVTGRKWEMKSNQLLYNSYSYYRTNQSQFSSPCRHCRLTTLIWLKLPHLI